MWAEAAEEPLYMRSVAAATERIAGMNREAVRHSFSFLSSDFLLMLPIGQTQLKSIQQEALGGTAH